MYHQKLGIVGGFGAYATLNFYKRILEVFAAENEREYPHIIMDNNFTMPSRTRALLYNESYDVVVREIAESIKKLLSFGADKLVLVCGTAHYFLEDVYKLVPQAESKIVDMIEILGQELKQLKKREALVIAAEGALEKGLYSNRLHKYDIVCCVPSHEHFSEIRYFIEAVKRNQLSPEVGNRFLHFLDIFKQENIILGCTEFPVLINHMITLSIQQKNWDTYMFFDPLEMTIMRLKQIMI